MKPKLRGKGMWIWEICNCERGDISAIVAKAVEHNLSHVLVKVADGRKVHTKNKGRYRPLIAALQAARIQAWVWQYAYSYHATEEARLGAAIANNLGADGFCIDAEKEYKGQYYQARRYGETLRDRLDNNIPIAFSSYYLPHYHRTLPWAEFLAICDYNMPQIYWHTHSPEWAIRESIRDNAPFGVPIFPTIAGHTRFRHSPQQMRRAIQIIAESWLPGFNVWSWQHMNQRRGRWDVIRDSRQFDGIQIVLDEVPEGEPPTRIAISCNARLEQGRLRADTRALLEPLGYIVNAEHLKSHREVRIRKCK